MEFASSYWLYMHHNQELEDVIETIFHEAQNGNYSFTLDIEDDFSEEELKYIEGEVRRRLNEY